MPPLTLRLGGGMMRGRWRWASTTPDAPLTDRSGRKAAYAGAAKSKAVVKSPETARYQGLIADVAGYDRFVAAMARARAIPDASFLWWTLRPSVRFPTLEIRVADSCTRLPGALSAMKRGSARCGRRRNTASPLVPLITFHGDRDETVHETNAHELVAAATAATGVPVEVKVEAGKAGGRRYARALSRDAAGRVLVEQWTVADAGHAWSGGDPAGSHADAAGPNASREMLRFFLEQRRVGG